MARVFVATSGPQGWSLGRWRQVSPELWEEQKQDGSQEISSFEVLVGSDTPGSTSLRLRLAGKNTEVLVMETTIQVFTEGQYLGEYVGYWEVLESELPVPTPAEVPSQAVIADVEAPNIVDDEDDEEHCEAMQPQKSAPPPSSVQAGQLEGLGDSGAFRSVKSEPVPDCSNDGPKRVLPRRSKRGSSPPSPQKWPPLESPKSPSRKAAFPDASPETTTQLAAAAASGDVATLQGLLQASADPDAGSALLLAAEGGHVEAVQALIAAGADVNAMQDGKTAMTVAYEKGHQEVLRALFGATFQSLETAVVGGGSPAALQKGILRKLPDSAFEEWQEGLVGELHSITERIKELGKVTEPERVEKVAPYVPSGEVVTIGQLAVKEAMTTIVDSFRRPATVG